MFLAYGYALLSKYRVHSKITKTRVEYFKAVPSKSNKVKKQLTMKRPLSLKKKPARQRPPGTSFTGRILNTIYEDDTPNRSMKDDTSKTMNYHDDDDGDVGEGAFDNHNATMRIVRLDNNEHENIGAGGDNNPSSYQREHQVRSIF